MPSAMLPADIKRLQSIQSFDSLVTYLRDDLDWPLDQIDIEDLTFEYSPEELGLQQQYVVKLKSIKQLRPLVTHQPWGIFYLEFERKTLPVVVLRRILKELVPKKRASANPDERTLWQKQDLLFISSQGEDAHRRLSFAHFRDLPDGRTGLDTFDWDDRETQFAGIGLALEKLHWPPNASDVDAWRKGWASAFTRPHGSVIQNAEQLSRALAELAGRTRAKVEDIYQVERPDGPLHKLFEAFKTALVHDLTPSRFADMVAQTVAYGLFAARAERGDTLHLSHLAEMIPATNPFLRELFGEIETLADDPDSYLSFDELGVSDIVALLNAKNIPAIVEDFGRQTGGGREDPVIHFYESFLKDYDAAQRVQRGVFYTPQPVVSFIVRSVDRILRDEFGLEDGLADTTTWGEMLKNHSSLTLPAGVSPDAPFVQILDPATGTGTFLVEVIDVIWRTMTAKWEKAGQKSQIHALWNAYVPAHLLPRVNGFELMMASYAIAHVKLGLKLRQTGYEFGSGERLRVFLTNTLEEPDELGAQKTMSTAFSFLAHESRAADAVKRDTPVTVIIGNPPYSSVSSNMGKWIRTEVNKYIEINGQRIKEKSKRNPLQNDYVKFLRFADILLSKTSFSVVSLITSNSYIDGRTLRGLRWHFLEACSSINIVNLFGDSKKSDDVIDDQNVFDITEGVSIITAQKRGLKKSQSICYSSLKGSRQYKYDTLVNENGPLEYIELYPTAPYYLFQPVATSVREEFFKMGSSLEELFSISGAGIITNRDDFATAYDSKVLVERMVQFADTKTTDVEIREQYGLKDNSVWKLPKARMKFRQTSVSTNFVTPLSYRPFDSRLMYYEKNIVFNPRFETMNHLRYKNNLALVSTGQIEALGFNHVFVSRVPVEKKLATHYGASVVFPLYLHKHELTVFSEMDAASTKVNLSDEASDLLEMIANVDQITIQPELAVFFYIYAVLHSPSYRLRYIEELKTDFPRIPSTYNPKIVSKLVRSGRDLVSLHLMEQVGPNPAAFPIPGSSSVDAAPKYDEDDRRVFINKTQYFAPVPPEVWAFQIGGYQVCHKWLKDRKGRTLTEGDITHYGSIVAALGETIRLMAEIDAVIEEHGGWPLQ